MMLHTLISGAMRLSETAGGGAPLPTVISAFGSNHFLADRFAVPGSVIATHEPRQPIYPSLSKMQGYFLLSIIVLGTALRILAIPHNPVVSTDSCVYLVAGENLVSGKGYTSINGYPEMTYPPLFPLVAGLMNLLVGNLETAGILNTLVFGALLIPAVWLLAWLLYESRPMALGAALVVACHPRMVEMSVNAIADAQYVFLLLTAMIAFVLAITKARPAYYVATGLCVGLSYLTRPIGFFYIFIFLAAAIFLRRRTAWKENVLWRDIGCMFVAFTIAAFPYLWYVHARGGIWSISPEATSLWGVVLDYEKQVYGSAAGSMGYPSSLAVVGGWVHHPAALIQLLARNAHVLFLRNFHVVFPPWFFWPALLGFLLAPVRHVRRNCFLLAMFLPLGIQFLHNFNYRHVFPVIPLVAMGVPTGIGVLAKCMHHGMRGLDFLPGGRRWGTGEMKKVCWVIVVFLLILPTVFHAIKPEELPLEHKRAGLWLKEKWGTGKIIMSRKPWVSFYSAGLWHAIPDENFDYVLAAAKKLRVEFLVLDERCILQTRPQLANLLNEGARIPGMERVYEEKSGKKIVLYRVGHGA